MIGPEGQTDGRPEGGQLRAGTVRLTVDFDGSFALSSNGLPTNWHGKSSIEYGQCLTHTSASNLPPTDGYGKSSIEYGLCLTCTCIQPACQQAGTSNCVNVNDGIGTVGVAD